MVTDMEEKNLALGELVSAAQQGSMSRLSFIRRALGLGLSAVAVAGLLDAIEGPVEGALAAPARSSSIRFSSWGSADEQTTIKQILGVFAKRYPSISVTPELAAWGDYWPKYTADVAAKATADVQFLTNVPTYAAEGALLDIRALLRKHKKTVPAGYTKGQLALFEWNGHLYGVPRDSDTKVIFYNKKLFSQANLALPTGKWSWSDLRTLAKKLTVKQGNRISQYGFSFETGLWRLYIWENGVELFDSDSTPTKVTFNTPAAAKAIQFMADLINKDQVTPAASQIVDSTNVGPMFASGQLAMSLGNHALVPTFVKTPGLDWHVVGLPHFAGHKTINAAGGAGYTISRWTHDLNAAYTLWSFMTGPVAATIFAAGNDLVPVNPKALHSKSWLSKPYNKVFSQQTTLGHDFPSFPAWGNVINAVSSALDKVWIGEETAAQGLAQAADAARTALTTG
jgi:multiple sugar transport system substrate-binding protein